jgi:regulator of protease activity HflC (stomatin/prohibitin superfamily)
MIYSVRNLPNVLSKLLQAQLRNVAGTLDVDQIIEEAASLNVLTSLMESECGRWGVHVLFVKVQVRGRICVFYFIFCVFC